MKLIRKHMWDYVFWPLDKQAKYSRFGINNRQVKDQLAIPTQQLVANQVRDQLENSI